MVEIALQKARCVWILIFGILRYFWNYAIQSHIFSTVTRKATLSRPVQRKPSLLLSPRPFGRPDTQASTKVTRHLLYVNYFISFPRRSPVAEVRFILCCLLDLYISDSETQKLIIVSAALIYNKNKGKCLASN